jgi:hypothetical protein
MMSGMANRKDDGLAAKIEDAAKMIKRAVENGEAVPVPEADVPEPVKALFKKAEEDFERFEARSAASASVVDEIRAAMEDSLAKDRRREMAIEKILASEDTTTSTTTKPARPAKGRRVSPETDRISRDVPLCGANLSMGNKKIARMLREYWDGHGENVAVSEDALIQRIKRVKAEARKK